MMEKKIARAFSLLFHPLLLPTYAFIILLELPVFFSMVIPESSRWLIVGIIFLSSFIMPAIFVYMLVKVRNKGSVYMKEKEERFFPYVITVVFFYITYFLVRKTGLSPVFAYVAAGTTFMAFITLVINFFWKISSHMIAMGSMTGLMVGISFLSGHYFLGWIMVLILLSGIIGFSRLVLESHTPGQVYAGYILGFLSFLLMFSTLV